MRDNIKEIRFFIDEKEGHELILYTYEDRTESELILILN